jgi:tRNA modification GTPase
MKTIAGIATAPGNAGVGIVRISGKDSLSITMKMFEPVVRSGNGDTSALTPRLATLGHVFGEGFRDEAVCIFFQSPNSFTGDDVVEIQAHGGYYLLQRILATAISHGCAAATAGEFSKTAFLNGRISLNQAEAIIDIINAENDIQLKCASSAYSGMLRERLMTAEQELLDVSAQIEASIDYPEEDIQHATISGVMPKIESVANTITELANSYNAGRIISNGIHVAVLGKPNVGKSSLFNALLQRDRSIITEIAGTTTDTVTDSVMLNGVKIVLTDTAGIRDANGMIEQLGIQRSKQAIAKSDICLCVFDLSSAPDDQDTEILKLSSDCTRIIVLNKNDLVRDGSNLECWDKFLKQERVIVTSASKGENISKIRQRIFDTVVTTPLDTSGAIITNARQANELSRANEILLELINNKGIQLDCLAADVLSALLHIGNITGTRTGEAVLDAVFSRFCLGK